MKAVSFLASYINELAAQRFWKLIGETERDGGVWLEFVHLKPFERISLRIDPLPSDEAAVSELERFIDRVDRDMTKAFDEMALRRGRP